MNPIERLRMESAGVSPKSELQLKEEAQLNKLRKLADIQDSTYTDMIETLERTHLCNVVRPTGFGKTKIFTSYAKNNHDKKILYVFDTGAVLQDIQSKYDTTNIDFISYALLSKIDRVVENKALLLNGGYSTIIFDESHLMGGENISQLLHAVFPKLVDKGIDILGGTATADRTDLMNVTTEFFRGNEVYEYDLEDAFNDGLIEVPMYTIMLYSSKRIHKDYEENKSNSFYVDRLKQLEYVYADKVGASAVYRNKVEKLYGTIPDYMKFIVFYPTIRAMNDSEESLRKEFTDAFPGMEINVYPVSSDPEHFSDLSSLNDDTFRLPSNHIDLITCVDMLNQGYHSDTLTGIVMNRSTLSPIVYTQQLGRCLSVMSTTKTIVFDNVANYKIDPLDGLAILQNLQSDETRGGFTGRERGFRRLSFSVDAEELEVAEWYKRLSGIKGVTQEMVDDAKRLYTDFDAPVDDAARLSKTPKWLLQEELEKEDKWEG